ncbi:hypothetical protein [Hyphomonas sp.]|uniref:hypothetical protein n=1 Tax=Hyphomonas sp. TaxID=87 RepID=UPI0030F4E94B
MKNVFTATPLMIVPVILYGAAAVAAGKPVDMATVPIMNTLGATIFQMPMVSGGRWIFELGDGILLIGMIMLFIEIIKSTNSKTGSLINHGLSMAIFVLSLIAFLLVRNFATSVFFLLMLMMLLDVIAGFMVTIVSARRDFGVGGGLLD